MSAKFFATYSRTRCTKHLKIRWCKTADTCSCITIEFIILIIYYYYGNQFNRYYDLIKVNSRFYGLIKIKFQYYESSKSDFENWII